LLNAFFMFFFLLQHSFIFQSEYLTFRGWLFIQFFVNCVYSLRALLNFCSIRPKNTFFKFFYLIFSDCSGLLKTLFTLNTFYLLYKIYHANDSTHILVKTFFYVFFWSLHIDVLSSRFRAAGLDVESCLLEFDPTVFSVDAAVSLFPTKGFVCRHCFCVPFTKAGFAVKGAFWKISSNSQGYTEPARCPWSILYGAKPWQQVCWGASKIALWTFQVQRECRA